MCQYKVINWENITSELVKVQSNELQALTGHAHL
jgi:hypothetical protein